MARIRYLAVLAADPAPLAGFYKAHFGLDELGRTPEDDVTLTDGGFNLTLFRNRNALHEPHTEQGIHHLGVAVDNVDAVVARYRARYPRGTVIAESGDLQHGQVRIFDPECHPVTLSQTNFGLRDSPPRVPRIAHLALNALDTEAILDFYTHVFGFREVFEAHKHRHGEPGYRNKHVGDGYTNVAIQAFYSDGEEGHEARFGIAHFGFLVPSSKAKADEVVTGGATVKARPARRTQSEIRMRDPEGNGCDLSQRGWEVDSGKWVRADAA
jgi:catechol 2,3-dioxygenase-like lactoylglutathione lyase family enzyme